MGAGLVTSAEAVSRARGAIGAGTLYVLGAGGRDPAAARPGETCDCSGFVAWVYGIDRFLPSSRNQRSAIPRYLDGAWFETSALAADARSPFGFVAEVAWAEAQPGDMLVWGDKGAGQGHVGLVTEVGESGPTRVVHCSKGNFRSFGDAIRETGVAVFTKNDAIAARVAWVA